MDENIFGLMGNHEKDGGIDKRDEKNRGESNSSDCPPLPTLIFRFIGSTT